MKKSFVSNLFIILFKTFNTSFSFLRKLFFRTDIILFLFIFLISSGISYAQNKTDAEFNKCGINLEKEYQLRMLYGDHWGYGYDSLLNDISRWETNDYIQIQSIGQSVLGREMYELTITDFSSTKDLKHRIYIHTRTHPGEVQSFRVSDEIINYLSSDTNFGNFLRSQCIFHIIPMYNPDGVELEYSRENANGVDLESNWGAENPEVEVVNLRNRFQELMAEDNPVEVALNMHSAHECNRFFWVHHQNGTSVSYYNLEETFVESVRSHFPEGIKPFDSHVSWDSGNPGKYPESWWWTNHAESVMALTYEDMNCSSAGDYNKTAYAILYGISDFLDLGYTNVSENMTDINNIKVFPNPFSNEINIKINNINNIKNVIITDILGKEVKHFTIQKGANGSFKWNGKSDNGENLPSGVYLCRFISNNQNKSIKLIKQ